MISVLMPVYNGERHLRKAIDSILNQTYRNFELLICNDASTDNSKKIVESYSDSRIRLIENIDNSGIVFTRNKLIEEAKGEYIALLDCDDISLPTRFEKQISFLEKNLDYGICGAWATLVDENENKIGSIQLPQNDQEIKTNLLFQSSFVQSSVMIRTQALGSLRYDSNYPVGEDFDLWVQFALKTKMHNLSSYEVLYRWHSENISHSKKELMIEKRKEIIAESIKNTLNINISTEKLEIHHHIGSLTSPTNLSKKEFLTNTQDWFVELIKINKKNNAIKNNVFIALIWYRLIFWCFINKVFACNAQLIKSLLNLNVISKITQLITLKLISRN